MTEQEIEKKAEEYANKVNKFAEDESVYFAAKYGYVSGANSRDWEVEMLQNQIEELSEQLKMNAENIQKLSNPWINVEKHPDDVTKDYLLEYEDGSHIVAMWDSGMWMSKNLHPLKEPTCWMSIPKLKKEK